MVSQENRPIAAEFYACIFFLLVSNDNKFQLKYLLGFQYKQNTSQWKDLIILVYCDTSANEDNSFRNYIR